MNTSLFVPNGSDQQIEWMIQFNESIANEMIVRGQQFKKVGGNFFTSDLVASKFEKFVHTAHVLSSIKRYAKVVPGDDFMVHQISEYEVDQLIGKVVIVPQEILFHVGDDFRKNVKVQYGPQNIAENFQLMDPAAFKAFQIQLLSQFKKVPVFTTVESLQETVHLASLNDFMNGSKCHITDTLRVLSKTPAFITCHSTFWEDDYFDVPVKYVIEQLVVNMYSDILTR